VTVAAPGLPGRWSHPLLIRIASAAVLIAITAGLLLLGRAGMLALVVLLAALALWEFRHLSGLMGAKAPTWLLYPLGFYFTFSGTEFGAIPVQLVLAVALIGGLGAFLFLPGRRQGLDRWAMALAGGVYVGMPLNFYLLLYTSGSSGLAWVLTVVVAIIVGDAAALLIGSWLGRHPFFPAISPKKTWEGAGAGFAACIATFLLAGAMLLHLPWWQAAIMGGLVGISGMVGDLVESQMKRRAGVKDSSNLIPGHGGILDRMDSALFAPIVVYLYGTWLHLL
jgi:phosphatidate cytidylyltransferase